MPTVSARVELGGCALTVEAVTCPRLSSYYREACTGRYRRGRTFKSLEAFPASSSTSAVRYSAQRHARQIGTPDGNLARCPATHRCRNPSDADYPVGSRSRGLQQRRSFLENENRLQADDAHAMRKVFTRHHITRKGYDECCVRLIACGSLKLLRAHRGWPLSTRQRWHQHAR